MPAKDPAAYMRDYRARKKGVTPWSDIKAAKMTEAEVAITESEPYRLLYADLVAAHEEIARLKRELAKRPGGELVFDNGPVDEPRVHRETTEARRERQKVIDEALRKVNRTKKGKP